MFIALTPWHAVNERHEGGDAVLSWFRLLILSAGAM